MERYYNILGIPNNSSKEVIKKAYHSKMKALHPDKLHGTALEDTATFFATEINEAYNQLMTNFKDNNESSTHNKQPSFIEENIYIETMGYLKYTLSNNINVIINEIYNRVKCTLPDTASQILWNINPALSHNVKKVMNTHKYKYSMTSYFEGSIEYVIINKKTGNDWYYAGYEINSRKNNTTPYYQSYNNSYYNSSKSKERNPFSIFIKIIIAVIIFGVIFNYFNNQQISRNQPQTYNNRNAQVFVNVIACEWLNVRSSPSSTNNNNYIEAIRVNTRVEIIEKVSNGWVRIRYNNGKTGYVHGNYLSN